MVRYADDFVVLCRFVGEPIRRFLSELLEGKMGLTLNPRKTRVLDLREKGAGLDFLGYTFRFDADLKGGDWRYLNLFPSAKSCARRRAEVRVLTSRGRVPLVRMVAELNDSSLSWAGYFRLGYPSKAFRRMDGYVQTRLDRFLRSKSQRRMRPPEGVSRYAWLQSLGLVRLGDPETLAYLRRQGLRQADGKAGCGKSARPV